MSSKFKHQEKLQSWIDLQIGPTPSNGAFETQENALQPLTVQEETTPPDHDFLDNIGKTVRIKQKVEGWLATFFLLFSESEVRNQARKLNKEIKEVNDSLPESLIFQSELNIEELCQRWQRHNVKCA